MEEKFKIIKIKVSYDISVDQLLENVREKKFANIHIDPYYKGLVKFHEISDFILYIGIMGLSDKRVKASPPLMKIYSFVVPKDWNYKENESHYQHIISKVYNEGREIRVKYKVEIQKVSEHIQGSQISKETVKPIYKLIWKDSFPEKWEFFKRYNRWK